MTDVLIRGMKMPKNCIECPLLSKECSCKVTGTWEWADVCGIAVERLPDCPLIALPERRGRLIDADALWMAFEDNGDINLAKRKTVEEVIADAITIVPADKEDAE